TADDGQSAVIPQSYTDGVHTTYYRYADGNTTGEPDYTLDGDGIPTYYKYTDGTDDTPAGLVQDVIDAQGHDTHYDYADLVVTAITTLYGTPAAQTTTYEYDDRENVKEVTDPEGRHTQYFYNFSDLLIERHDPDPATGLASPAQAWIYTYDSNGNLTSVED